MAFWNAKNIVRPFLFARDASANFPCNSAASSIVNWVFDSHSVNNAVIAVRLSLGRLKDRVRVLKSHPTIRRM